MTPERSLRPHNSKPASKVMNSGEITRITASPDPKKHILIVDDEKMIVKIGQEMLEYLGYQVTGHTCSMAALESVRRQPKIYDLVITDFTMPQMNGVELARELNRLSPGTPIILYSAKSWVVSPENARELGIKDYLMKPVTAVELHQAIRRVLDAELGERRSNPK